MAACRQVISVSRWSWLSQKIFVLLQVCIWSSILDNAMCSSLGGLVNCVSCTIPTYTHAHGRTSSFASSATLVSTNANPTPMLTRTVMTSSVSETSMWSMSAPIKTRYQSITSTKVVTLDSILTNVVEITGAKLSASRTSLNTQASPISYSSNKKPSHHEKTVSCTPSSVEYQVSTVEFQASSIEYQTKVPERCLGDCETKEGATKLTTQDKGFQLTLPIKYAFLAAGMAVPFVICIIVAVFANYRFQRQMQRQKKTKALNSPRVAPVHLGRVKANENRLSQFLTVPGSELVPLNALRREAHINYACSEENADHIASAQV